MNRFPRPPLLLYRYLTLEILAPFFASFLILTSVFFLVKLIPFLNVALELGIGFADFVILFSYIFPNMFLYSMPMAIMTSMIIAFSRLTVDREILALKASGVSVYTILPPVVLLSLIIAGITGYLSIKVIPSGETAMKQLLFQLAKEKIHRGIKENTFTEALGDVVVCVQSINQETGVWQNVWVSDMRGRTLPTIIMGQRGSMIGDTQKMRVTIVLEDGSIIRPNGVSAQTVSFDRYQINIPLHIPSSVNGKGIAHQSVESMTMGQLRQTALLFGGNSEKGREALIHFHKRIALPAGCFILSLLGLPLGLQARAGRGAIGIPLGLGFFILYYILITAAKTLAEETTAPVAMAMWFPNIFYIILTLILVRQTANEKPLIPTPVSNVAAAFAAKYLSPLAGKIWAWFNVPDRPSNEKIPDDRYYKQGPKKLTGPASLSEETIHGDPHSMLCHIPECALHNCPHCTITFKSLEIANKSGFTLCDACKTLLEQRGPF